MSRATPPVFRFAPSPNGALHLGHAYSALLNEQLARQADGEFLLRIEDIDTARCSPKLEAAMLEDLRWLGLNWSAEPRRQSEHFSAYRAALERLIEAGLAYPAFLSRREIREAVAGRQNWPHDPDGAPHYPGDERYMTHQQRRQAMLDNPTHAWRLDTARAVEKISAPVPALTWLEEGEGQVKAEPSAWGDVVLARADIATSYHLSVVVDDAAQGVTNIVRGRDLFQATSVHRLLQILLGLPEPTYRHHRLILDEGGRKLSKSSRSTGLADLREQGVTGDEIRKQLGFGKSGYESQPER